MGYLGVWILVQHLEGYDVSEGGTDLGTGEHVVTRDNLDDGRRSELFDPDLQAKRTPKICLRACPSTRRSPERREPSWTCPFG